METGKDLFDSIQELLAEDADLTAMEQILWGQYGDRCATLVLDSCGCTRTTKARGIVHFLVCVMRCRDIVRPVFERHGGRSFRAEVDNLYCEFETPDQALEAAIEANEAVMAADIMLTDAEPFQICIGIGYGRVLRSHGEGVFGHEMNLASKLGEDTAEGREILLTQAAYSNLGDEHKNRFEKLGMTISGIEVTYHLTRV